MVKILLFVWCALSEAERTETTMMSSAEIEHAK